LTTDIYGPLMRWGDLSYSSRA